MSEIVLSCNGLSKTFRQGDYAVEVLKDVDFDGLFFLSGENWGIQKRIINMETAKPIGEIQSAFFIQAPFT